MGMSEEFMTVKEVAKYLRLSVYTVYRMAEKGKIPALKAGKKWRFRKEDINKWMKNQARGKRGR